MKILDWLHSSQVHGRRIQILSRLLADLISPEASVLDVGCGDGLLAHSLCEQRPDISITGIDIEKRAETHFPVQLFDGQQIPCPEKSVDVVLFVDVLHHADDPMRLLTEAKRVAKTAILIKDHTKDGFLAAWRLRAMDWVGNARYGVPLPYNYWSRDQWQHVFKQLNLSIDCWVDRLQMYPPPADWVFGSSLHFIARLVAPVC